MGLVGLAGLAQLVRAPAALSVPGDVLAGTAATRHPLGVRTFGVMGLSVCLYWAGMAHCDKRAVRGPWLITRHDHARAVLADLFDRLPNLRLTARPEELALPMSAIHGGAFAAGALVGRQIFARGRRRPSYGGLVRPVG